MHRSNLMIALIVTAVVVTVSGSIAFFLWWTGVRKSGKIAVPPRSAPPPAPVSNDSVPMLEPVALALGPDHPNVSGADGPYAPFNHRDRKTLPEFDHPSSN